MKKLLRIIRLAYNFRAGHDNLDSENDDTIKIRMQIKEELENSLQKDKKLNKVNKL